MSDRERDGVREREIDGVCERTALVRRRGLRLLLSHFHALLSSDWPDVMSLSLGSTQRVRAVQHFTRAAGRGGAWTGRSRRTGDGANAPCTEIGDFGSLDGSRTGQSHARTCCHGQQGRVVEEQGRRKARPLSPGAANQALKTGNGQLTTTGCQCWE